MRPQPTSGAPPGTPGADGDGPPRSFPQGTSLDHGAGFASTDGQWHHIAVTWESASGEVRLFENGRAVWRVRRAKGRELPSGGTLVVGREQDCRGGCFDSGSPGARGRTDPGDAEYGSQASPPPTPAAAPRRAPRPPRPEPAAPPPPRCRTSPG